MAKKIKCNGTNYCLCKNCFSKYNQKICKECHYIKEEHILDWCSCCCCKYYEQGEIFDNYGQSLIPEKGYTLCNKNNNGNLKGFPFKGRLNCFEEKESENYGKSRNSETN